MRKKIVTAAALAAFGFSFGFGGMIPAKAIR